MNKKRNIDGTFATEHNGTRTRLYRVWCAMKERCNNPHNKRYSIYGGRGIRVCNEWQDFFVFREWMLNNGYQQGLTIDRINRDGNYCPENCRLATTAQQNRNYSRNRFLTYNGKTQCVKDWGDELGINPTTIVYRLRCGRSVEDALRKFDYRSIRFKTL